MKNKKHILPLNVKEFLKKHPDLKYKKVYGNLKDVPDGIGIDLDDMSKEQIKDFLEILDIDKSK